MTALSELSQSLHWQTFNQKMGDGFEIGSAGRNYRNTQDALPRRWVSNCGIFHCLSLSRWSSLLHRLPCAVLEQPQPVAADVAFVQIAQVGEGQFGNLL